jgi:hypothetical protein
MVIVLDRFRSKSAMEEARSIDFVGGKRELTEVLHVREGGERGRRTEGFFFSMWCRGRVTKNIVLWMAVGGP